MPSVKLPGGGWTVLAQPHAAPAPFTRDDGTVMDLDGMLRRIGLRTTDFDGAPTHKPKPLKDPTRCRHGHLWTEHGYKIPGTTTRICRACKEDSRMRARASAKASSARRKAA